MKLDELEPKIVGGIFEEITKTPRCSGHEYRLQKWVEEWSENKGIPYYKDQVDNLFLSKKAYMGFEEYPVLTFQVHQDMVCEKVTKSSHNFETDPIDLQISEGYVTANGTTPGADNGIKIAMAMATLMDPETAGYGKLEVMRALLC